MPSFKIKLPHAYVPNIFLSVQSHLELTDKNIFVMYAMHYQQNQYFGFYGNFKRLKINPCPIFIKCKSHFAIFICVQSRQKNKLEKISDNVTQTIAM